MPVESSAAYPFGDMPALARPSWPGELSRRLAGRGYDDYRRSDAGALRLPRRGPAAVGQLGTVLGVTRQAAGRPAASPAARWLSAVQPGDSPGGT
jgi:hypothetical protein